MPAKAAYAALALFFAVVLTSPAGLAAAPSSGEGHPAPAAEISPISEAKFQEMLAAVVEEQGNRKMEQGDTLRVELPSEAKVLFFTRPGHWAHPGIVAVQIVEQDGLPTIATSGWWAGDAQAFDTWFKVFQRRNERLSREWQEE